MSDAWTSRGQGHRPTSGSIRCTLSSLMLTRTMSALGVAMRPKAAARVRQS